ncbi:hypothetical protein BOX15_Mlig013986g1 [Macrostomum lignano]|uniref:Ig-like domain-containing protein n=1 Tax=Macrostomum lignano TaxID=282301 RepID=A0A267ET33_9PLAT|nr:hypothetical protein BOX15_Mlig013986g1 [Macrostomum lignano]
MSASLISKLVLQPLLIVLLYATGQSAADADKPGPALRTIPFQQSHQVGSNLTIQCRISAALQSAGHSLSELVWRLPDSCNNSNFASSNGTLIGWNLAESDSGIYLCLLADSDANATAEVKVYRTSLYRPQLLLVWLLNGALGLALLLMIACRRVASLAKHRRMASSSRCRRRQPDGNADNDDDDGDEINATTTAADATTMLTGSVEDTGGEAAGLLGSADDDDAASADDGEVDGDEQQSAAPVAVSRRRGNKRLHRHHSTLPKPEGDGVA